MQRSHIAFVVILLSAFCQKQCSGQNDQQTEQRYAYQVDLGAIANDRLEINLETPKIEKDTITFFVPSIVPGIYGKENYGQFISAFSAFDADGKILKSARQGDNSWMIEDARRLARIRYLVDDSWEEFGNQRQRVMYRSAGACFDAGKRFIINHNCLFGYFDDMADVRFRISIQHPENLVVATSLRRNDGPVKSTVDHFVAGSYRELVDNPVVYGRGDQVAFKISGTTINVAVYSDENVSHAAHFSRTLQPLMEAQARYLGGKLPVDRYTFIIVWEKGAKDSFMGDGLEHSHSTLCLLEGNSVERVTGFIRAICAHEFFHILIPLTVHSDEIANYDFNDPKQSRHLWLYEGMTEYFTIHMPIKEKLENQSEFLEKVQRKIIAMKQFRDDISMTELSSNAIDFQDQYYNFYLKGALLGLCLDIKLRELSDGKIGTQELVQKLSTKYGKEKSFRDDELFDVIADLTFPEIRQWFADHVEGIKPLPLESTLKSVGIDYDQSTNQLRWTESPSQQQQSLRKHWIN